MECPSLSFVYALMVVSPRLCSQEGEKELDEVARSTTLIFIRTSTVCRLSNQRS